MGRRPLSKSFQIGRGSEFVAIIGFFFVHVHSRVRQKNMKSLPQRRCVRATLSAM